MKKNNDIEVLRAVGILYVIISHFPVFMPWNPSWHGWLFNHTYFWSGVDLFFAVSGFVIMKSIYPWVFSSEKDAYISATTTFWIKRFYRLIPASWTFLLLTYLASIFFNSMGTLGVPSNNLADAIGQFFYLSNWRSYYCTAGQAACGLNNHYWSLSLEEQFYFILPIAILILRKNVVWFFAALIIIQFPTSRIPGEWLWLNRVDSMMWGCLIAMATETKFYQKIKPTSLKSIPYKVLIASVLLYSLAFFARGEIVSFNMGVVALVSASMVWISSYDEGLLFGKYISNNKVVLWIASRSYSIYLSHPLAYVLMMEYCKQTRGQLNNDAMFTIMFFGTLLTIALSELSFRFIESPLRKRGAQIVQPAR
ncbi:acyltransferase [Enterobacter quasiroggenkampii]|uniref:acyltransferase family protein n=1 Tax=Enterobacter quasiroggenkampii TaxID=2497436 RepID=UPI002FF8D288